MKKSSDVHAAIRQHLAAHKVELDTAELDEASGETRVTGRVWHPATIPGFDHLGQVHVQLPVHGRLKVGQKGDVKTVGLTMPSHEEIAEAGHYAATLAAHGEIEGVTGETAAAGRSTHRIERGPDGQQRLTRKGFSAF